MVSSNVPVTVAVDARQNGAAKGFRFLRAAAGLTKRQPLGVVSGAIMMLWISAAILAPQIAPYEPNAISHDVLQGPSSEHWFGTDVFGRDLASRVLYGARVSLGVSLIGVAASALAGLVIGLLSGYLGGAVDATLQRISDVIMAFPSLVLGIVVVAALGSSMSSLLLVIGLVGMPTINRVVRSATLELKHQPYVEAARVLGASNARILIKHVLPNATPSFVTITTASIGTMILLEAALGYLGLSAQPPTASWGAMIGGDAVYQMYNAPWIVIFPGLAIASVVFSVNLLGDLVRDELDPRLRTSR